MTQPFFPCSFNLWVQGGCSSSCHHTCLPTIRKWEEARVCFWKFFIYLPGRTGTDRRQGNRDKVHVYSWKLKGLRRFKSCLSHLLAVLVPCNCHKLPQTWWSATTETHPLIVLEARRSTSVSWDQNPTARCWQGRGSRGESFLQLLVAVAIP